MSLNERCYAALMTVADEISAVLDRGPARVKVIAEEIDRSQSSVRAQMHRHQKRFTKSRTGEWENDPDWIAPPPKEQVNSRTKAEASKSRYEAARVGCEICGSRRAPGGFVQDHDHISGENRGMLCSQCNIGLGCFLDQPDFLQAAAEYVQRYEQAIDAAF